MSDLVKTSWGLIKEAADGESEAREEFARRYAPITRAYLASRWRNSSLLADIEDAIQEVFVDCFKQGGVLVRADPDRPSGFRAFFYGVARNVALTFEKRGIRASRGAGASGFQLEDLADTGETPSHIFDQAWARSLVKEAASRQAEKARVLGNDAVRRVEILRLRFQEGLPIREIAKVLKVEKDYLHHEYAKARREYEASLREVIALENPDSPDEVDRFMAEIMAAFG